MLTYIIYIIYTTRTLRISVSVSFYIYTRIITCIRIITYILLGRSLSLYTY